MKKALLVVAGIAGALTLAGCNLKNEDAKPAGDLESLHPLACVDYTKIQPSDTPADIAKGASACMDSKDYDRAAHMIMVGSVYTAYDVERVADTTAHSAAKAVFKDAFRPQDRDQMGSLLGALMKLDTNDAEKQKVCKFIADNGKPTYTPDYMISHGTDPQDPALKADLDTDAAWKSAQAKVECGE